MMPPIDALAPAAPPPAGARPQGMDALGQGDFLRLLTVQMQQQDPFSPLDNKEMLAQMAQFSALAGAAQTNATLDHIAQQLDLLLASGAAVPAPPPPPPPPPAVSPLPPA